MQNPPSSARRAAVGSVFLDILEQRDFPVSELRLCASSRSVGRRLKVRGQEIEVEAVTPELLSEVDIRVHLGERRRQPRGGPAGSAAGRGGHRRQLGLSHGPGRAAGRAGSQRR